MKLKIQGKCFDAMILGYQNGGDSFFSFEYGLQVFDLCADQICQLMEKPHINKGN